MLSVTLVSELSVRNVYEVEGSLWSLKDEALSVVSHSFAAALQQTMI